MSFFGVSGLEQTSAFGVESIPLSWWNFPSEGPVNFQNYDLSNVSTINGIKFEPSPIGFISSGVGINVVDPDGTPIINNTGVLSISSSSEYITFSQSTGNTILNMPTFISSIIPGSGITLSDNNGPEITISNSGVLNLSAGSSGISIGGSSSNPIINNTGVTQLIAGTGIALSANTGSITVSAPQVGTVTGVSAGYGINIDNTNPAVPQVATLANNTSPGGNIVIYTDNQNPTPSYYYGVKPYFPYLAYNPLILQPVNNNTPANQLRVSGIQTIAIQANPQNSPPDLTTDVIFSDRTDLGKLYTVIPGLTARIFNNNFVGNNNMFININYENPSGVITLVGTVQLSPTNWLDITPILALAGATNGTPYSYPYIKVGGAIGAGLF